MANRPIPEVDVSEHLVRGLLREQAPERSDDDLTLVGRGWDNTNWRLGADLMIRIPHRGVAAPLIDHEQRWLPVLAPRFNEIAIPSPVVSGTPSPAMEFPWPWSIVPWNPGTEAAGAALADPQATAGQLGRFLHELHQPAPDDAPPNPFRGGPIRERVDVFNERCNGLGDRIDVDRARSLFAEATQVPDASDRVWLHADLHTRNLVVDDGDLTAVIDWGDICSGDRATDLAGAFMLVPDHVDTVVEAAGADDHAWRRAQGWALHFASIYLTNADDDPVMTSIGTRLFEALGVATTNDS